MQRGAIDRGGQILSEKHALSSVVEATADGARGKHPPSGEGSVKQVNSHDMILNESATESRLTE